ncbi:MAG: YdcF family protein [Bacteroidales bacterium]|nr:YdcF family protein [Bacteroidales bacterium]
MKKLFKRSIKTLLLLGIIAVVSIFTADYLVKSKTEGKIFTSTKDIPKNRVGLLLGTSKYVLSGNVNLYYRYRINAAVELFKAKKIDYILVSGDNGSKTYDEPTAIKDDLIKRGIPANKIFLDYAGFRTLDSVIRSREIFGQKSITVISQEFHNQRAIYIALSNDINAIGYNAKDVNRNYGFKTRIREKLARVKMFIDIIIGKEPKFLGDKITIE